MAWEVVKVVHLYPYNDLFRLRMELFYQSKNTVV